MIAVVFTSSTSQHHTLHKMHALRAYAHPRVRTRPTLSSIAVLRPSSASFPKVLERPWFRRSNSCQAQTPSTPAPSQLHIPPANSHGISTLECDEELLHHYTSGRWLWNEKEQLARRYVKFNMDELSRIAVRVTGSKSCTQVQKLPEGNFSKVLLMIMDDGKEVIAKLPNPNAGHQHFTTASEVATMDYVRDCLCYVACVKIYSHSSLGPQCTQYPSTTGILVVYFERNPSWGRVYHHGKMSWDGTQQTMG